MSPGSHPFPLEPWVAGISTIKGRPPAIICLQLPPPSKEGRKTIGRQCTVFLHSLLSLWCPFREVMPGFACCSYPHGPSEAPRLGVCTAEFKPGPQVFQPVLPFFCYLDGVQDRLLRPLLELHRHVLLQRLSQARHVAFFVLYLLCQLNQRFRFRLRCGLLFRRPNSPSLHIHSP